MIDHRHLTDEKIEAAAESLIADGTSPSCKICRGEVEEFARYLATARAVAGSRAEPVGEPATLAVRRLRRSTYASRVLQELGRMLSRSPRKVAR